MSLRFIIGGAGAGKSTSLEDEIIRRSMEQPGRQFMLMVPDQFTMQTQREIVTRHPRRGIMNIDVQSFGRLCYRVAEEVGQEERSVLDDTGKNLILRRLAGELADALPTLGKSLQKQGYVHEVKSVISEFMQYGIGVSDVDRLVAYAKSKPLLSRKLQDVQRLYMAFEEYLGERYITKEGRLDVLAANIARSSQLKGAVVGFDGFTGFTPVQYNVISRMMECCSEVIVTLILPAEELASYREDDAPHRLFALSMRTMRTLEQLAKELGCPRGDDLMLTRSEQRRYAGRPALDRLEQGLFRAQVAGRVDEMGTATILGTSSGPHSQEITAFVAHSPREELQEILARVRDLCDTQGYAYRDVAVLTGDLTRYSPYAERLSQQYGVPVFVDQNHKLALNPFTEYLAGIFEVLCQDFSIPGVVRLVKSGMSCLTDEEGSELENYLLATGMRGRRRYEQAFTRMPRYIERLRAQVMDAGEEGVVSAAGEDGAASAAGGDGEASAAGEEGVASVAGEAVPDMALQAMARINGYRERLLQELAPMLELPGEAAAEEYSRALYEMIVRRDAYSLLEGYADGFAERGDEVRRREYGQIYRNVMELLEQIAELLQGERLRTSEYYEILSAGLEEVQVGILPQDVDRVVIGDMERTRLKPVKVLFFAGCNDGVVPRVAARGGVISDVDREFLAQSGYTLSPTPRERMYMQRLYLYHALSRPSERLILSYTEVDREGASSRPSYLMGHVRGLFPDLCVEAVEGRPLRERVLRGGLRTEELSRMLSAYAGGAMPTEDYQTLFTLFDEELSRVPATANRLVDAAFWQYRPQRLSVDTARGLYGSVLKNSVSRMERYAACAYAHFLDYGLHLRERESAALARVDIGDLYHRILERFGRRLLEQGLQWSDLSDAELDDLLKLVAEEALAEQGAARVYQDHRSAYQYERMLRILRRGLRVMRYQLAKGSFTPTEYELRFEDVIGLLPALPGAAGSEAAARMRLVGKIDRLDSMEQDGRLYIKVVDYKSGARELDYAEIYTGRQLQLPVYLGEALRLVRKRDPKREVVPAAVMYYMLQDPYQKAEPGAAVEDYGSLKMRGLISSAPEVLRGIDSAQSGSSDVAELAWNKDGSLSKRSKTASGEEIAAMLGFVSDKVAELGSGIMTGDKAVSPLGDDACKYCAFRECCPYDARVAGYHMRYAPYGKQEARERICHPRVREEADDAADGSEVTATLTEGE